MVFRPRIQKLSKDILYNIADDLIEVASNAKDKSAFRSKLISQKLRTAKEYSVLTSTDIDHAVKILSDKSNSPYAICKALNDISKKLSNYYRLLINIFDELR